jgi:anti-anti-sigma factor
MGRQDMGIALEKNDAGSVITLEGALDVNCAAALKTLLLEAFASGSEVRLALETATYLDATAVQLLWAAHQEAASRGVSLHLQGPMPEGVSAALADAGFPAFPVSAAAA